MEFDDGVVLERRGGTGLLQRLRFKGLAADKIPRKRGIVAKNFANNFCRAHSDGLREQTQQQ